MFIHLFVHSSFHASIPNRPSVSQLSHSHNHPSIHPSSINPSIHPLAPSLLMFVHVHCLAWWQAVIKLVFFHQVCTTSLCCHMACCSVGSLLKRPVKHVTSSQQVHLTVCDLVCSACGVPLHQLIRSCRPKSPVHTFHTQPHQATTEHCLPSVQEFGLLVVLSEYAAYGLSVMSVGVYWTCRPSRLP